MTARKILKGFTLVELLIVIAILGIIALIVIAAINPIEQANRARDTGMKSDASQLVSAIDRYFAAREQFPWVSAGDYVNDDAFGFVSAKDEGVGICGATCADEGILLATEELKPEFLNRNFIKAGDTEISDLLMIGKDAESSSSVYACYIPAAKSNREKSCADGDVYTLDVPAVDGTGGGTRTQVVGEGEEDPPCSGAEGTEWLSNGWYVCVPE